MVNTTYHIKTKKYNQIAMIIVMMMIVVYPVSYALGFAMAMS